MLVNIVIGSWGSYNECNDRALGSKWLDLSDHILGRRSGCPSPLSTQSARR